MNTTWRAINKKEEMEEEDDRDVAAEETFSLTIPLSSFIIESPSTTQTLITWFLLLSNPVQADWYMTEWSIQDWYRTDIWLIYNWYMTGIWLVYDWYMTDMWLIYDCDIGLIYEWYMTDIWLIHDCTKIVLYPKKKSAKNEFQKHFWS